MTNLVSVLGALTVSADAKGIITSALSKVPDDVSAKWLTELTIKDGHVTATYYSDLADKLSYKDFTSLYRALGYDFSSFEYMSDWRCSAQGCIRDPGYTCDPNKCGDPP